MAAVLNSKGFLNSTKAPPSLLKTIPVLKMTNLFPKAFTGAMLSSQALQVFPKKSG
jgi:hypothetical protein